MKIVRFADTAGNPGYGSLQPDGQVIAINDPFAGTPLAERGEAFAPARLLHPFDPVQIYGVGLNYADHAAETNKPLPERPLIFMKAINTAQSPGAPIVLPRHLASEKVDYEGELGFVISRTCKNVSPEDALDYVLGLTVANDVSARDWQFEWGGGQFIKGKSFDTFCPFGPAVVTLDEIADLKGMALETKLNGETVQKSDTGQLIFDLPYLISFLSGSTTLLPGTLILTGTPSGVGHARKPQARYLQPGDVVEVSIEGLGSLSNPVVAEA
jgi:2-keto-4-pentenoate hydratase/2-oxohepta-3-ene-1,7-dioic acid hydratase in catechol pathway